MNVLMVSAPLPCPRWGARTRNYHLLKALAREHTVSLLTFADNAEVEASEDLALLEACAYELVLRSRQPQQIKRWQQLISVLRGWSYLLHPFIVPGVRSAFEALLARDAMMRCC